MFLITVYGIKVRPESKKMTDKEEYIHYHFVFSYKGRTWVVFKVQWENFKVFWGVLRAVEIKKLHGSFFNGWGSNVSRLWDTTTKSPLSPPEFPVLICSTLEGWKAESTLEPCIEIHFKQNNRLILFFLNLLGTFLGHPNQYTIKYSGCHPPWYSI